MVVDYQMEYLRNTNCTVFEKVIAFSNLDDEEKYWMREEKKRIDEAKGYDSDNVQEATEK